MEANKDVVMRWVDAMQRKAFDEAVQCWAPDAINHASGRPGLRAQGGRDALRRVFGALATAFPDRRYLMEDVFVCGDTVVCRWIVSGTFGAPPPRPPDSPPGWVGVESTALVPASAAGKRYSVKHIHLFRIRDGLIAEHWAARDDLSLLIQLGAVSPPPETEQQHRRG